MQDLDDKDRRLLRALESDARASVVALARAVGLSRSATQERLARLERTGAIAGYTVLLGPVERRDDVRAWLAITYAPGTRCEQMLPRLRRLAAVVEIHALAGEPDVLVAVSAPDAAGIDATAASVRAWPGVASVRTHVVLARERAAHRTAAAAR